MRNEEVIGIFLADSTSWLCTTLSKWMRPVPIEKLKEGQTVEEVREFAASRMPSIQPWSMA